MPKKLKHIIKGLPLFKGVARRLDNLNERREWVQSRLAELPEGSLLLDAGCGSQQFRVFCDHLVYRGQDFGQYVSDEKKMLGAEDGLVAPGEGYQYGKLDYVGDVWNIDEADGTFDAILCTEVIEHIPYPNRTIEEFSRLIKPGGTLLLTAPSNSLRHMDPYFFCCGFSDRWHETILKDNGFEIEEITPVGDYYSWLAVEMARTAVNHGVIAKLLLLPSFLYYFNKKKTKTSVDTLCMGYHVKARKI